MSAQAIDFREESEELFQPLRPLGAEAFETRTEFKQWTFNDILGQLHVCYRAAGGTAPGRTRFVGRPR